MHVVGIVDVRDMPAAAPLSRLPRAGDAAAFSADPFRFLKNAAAMGDLVVLRDGGPIFSRRSDCPVAVAAFGAETCRRILSDGTNFAMPPSAAEGLALPDRLKTLNRGLHSMSGDRHKAQKAFLSAALSSSERLLPQQAIADAVDAAVRGLAEERMPMLATMRALLGSLAASILFGDASGRAELAATMADYFRLRQAASSPLGARGPDDRARFVEAGLRLDEMLRGQVERGRALPDGGSEAGGLLYRLARHGGGDAPVFDDAQIVAHANVLFMSMTEPVAVALTWIFLLLSQLPRFRAGLREAGRAEASPPLDRFVAETLRLLTPNAVMVRSVRVATELGGTPLPAGTEVVLAPIVAHRNPLVFPQPDVFDPQRWQSARPGPFEYMPFGGGLHVCIGQNLARRLIREIVLHMAAKFDLALADGDGVDWQIDIMLKPRREVYFCVSPAGSSPLLRIREWQGPSRALFDFQPEVIDRQLGFA